ncbi:alkaline phosphatase PhoX [Haloarchaeobius iranensis]|uniref:alkaline phosphatase PhoX n=1 Tax=Haloarchaeobius iranensis TaxID=996166 RepID=UPI001587B48C|nr:alkaline phosphatase PhoX [Haloarchaeobius iranensis]
MMEFTRRNLMASSVAAALGASVAGKATAVVDDPDTPGAPSVKGELKRFSTTALGAEVTGPYVFADGSLLYSLQHPSRDNEPPFDRAGVGYFSGFQFEMDGSNGDFEELSIPETEAERGAVRSGEGEWVPLAQEEDEIRGGAELLGVSQTPDGTNISRENFAGTQYGNAGYNPDCNQFVATNDEGTEGYLFTNWENSPGNVSRVPLSQDDDGEWSADLENAMNLSNTEAFREVGGTRINCYGDLSPWGTMLSSEENYAHPRVSMTSTVGDIAEAGTGRGHVGACQFWNRPNPSEIQGAVDDYYGENSWDIQGYWALTGVEFLAYYLGAEPVDQTGGNEQNTTNPIGDVYPNPYRYGYHVDIREPAADTPQPVKYYVMGRAAWEAPDVQGDRKTVYECSDGDSKGIYKFVADEPIDSYEDPMDVAGTLYAPKITNGAAAAGGSPAEVPLHVDWLELGHATNAEVASWIAEYDDVTQETYLETHAETDWTEDLAGAIAEADQTVVEEGNRNYITNEEILAWAAQYESEGPDGVDEELRRVPFLETRAAAKEVGASIEFNKAEGVDSRDDAGPGDFVYFGISEFNDDLANDVGDIQLDRVDGGVVYRAELERNYDVSVLEPVITGPDASDPADVADDALVNVDNVYVMDDGRVLCCEDADQFGRSYPNDALYVYQPDVILDVQSIAVQHGATGSADLLVSSLPAGVSGGDLTVTVTEPDVASITGVEFPDDVGLTEATVSDDGSSVEIRFSDVDRAVQPGEIDVPLASLDILAENTGTSDLAVEVTQLDDDEGSPIEATTRKGIVVAGPPPVVGPNPPTDPDGDGLYEDVNGNGQVDYDDIVVLFQQFDSDSVQLNPAAYDFNENGELDYDDIVTLYEEVN